MLGDADKTLDFVRKKLAEDVQGAPYRRDIEDGIRQFVADVASKRVEIRAHSTNKLHAKPRPIQDGKVSCSIETARPVGIDSRKAWPSR